MNIKSIFSLITVISGLLLFSACPKPQKYSEIPEITFKQIRLYDTIDILENSVKGYSLKFKITDGDGDIGLQTDEYIGLDVDSMYKNNFLAVLYEIINGDTLVVDSYDNYNYRIPYVEPQGQNKVLIADVYIDMSFSYPGGSLPYDSIFFDFFVIDRSLNRSNTESTPSIKLDTIGLFPPIVE